MQPVTVTLPYPISANRYWRSFVPRGGKRAIVVLSDEAKAYKQYVASMCLAAGIKPLSHRVMVHIDLFPQLPKDFAKRARLDPDYWDDDIRCIDIDNARKVLYDSLKGIAFTDDKWIWSDSAERMQPDGEARVVVTISPIIRARIQPALALG